MIEMFARRRVLIAWYLFFKIDGVSFPQPSDYVAAIAELDVRDEKEVIDFLEADCPDFKYEKEVRKEIAIMENKRVRK